MPIIKAVVHVPTGEFKNKNGAFERGPFEPQRPIFSAGPPIEYDPDYNVVVVPEGTTPRLHKWVNGARADKTAQEIATWDAAAPSHIDGREIMRRLAASTHIGLAKLAQTDAMTAKLWNTLRAGGQVDRHSTEFNNGAAYLKSIGIGAGKVWETLAAYDADMAAVQA